MKTEISITGGSTSFILFVVFLVLKLCNVINWSWWWITSPLWIPVGLFLSVAAIVFIVGLFYGVIKAILD